MKIKAILSCAAVLILAGCSGSEGDKPAAKLTPQTMSEKDFAKIDLNKDGTITYDEFDVATDNKGDLAGNAVYIQIDKNGNGVITKEEFVAPAQPAAATVTAPAAKDTKAEPAKAEKKDEPAKK